MLHKKLLVQLLKNISTRIALMVLFYGKLRLPLGHFRFFVLLNQQAKKGAMILSGVIKPKLTIENWISLHNEERPCLISRRFFGVLLSKR